MTLIKTSSLVILIHFLLLKSAQTDTKCDGTVNGDKHCKKDSSEDEPCFYEEAEETLFQWDPVEKGHIRNLELEDGKKYEMKTLSVRPRLFEISNFLTEEECDHIISKAKVSGLASSGLFFDKYALASKNYTQSHTKLVIGEFEIWDSDENGIIDVEDIKDFAVQTRFLYLDDADINDMFKDLNITLFDDGVITKEEFETLNIDAVDDYMKALRETHPRFRDRFSDQTWLRQDSSSDPILRRLRQRIGRLTQLPKEIIDGGEPLQVLRYDVNGHYHAHFDGQSRDHFPNLECCHFKHAVSATDCRLCRYITILYYLNDVEEGGETAFPVADNGEYEHSNFARRANGDFYNLSQFCHNATAVVEPKKGKAVLWYNHHVDENGWLGERDDYSLHGGCDIKKGEKWVANNWIPAPEFETKHKRSIYYRE